MKYYEIIGKYSKKVIGVTSDPRDVEGEEPDSIYGLISKKKFDEYGDDYWETPISSPSDRFKIITVTKLMRIQNK